MPRVIHFEIHADNPERGLAFYQKLFGWTFTRAPGPHEYWLVTTGPDSQPGINGGMLKRPGANPTKIEAINAFIGIVDVASVDETMAKAVASGGVAAMPKFPVPGVGWLAYFKDTEGNLVGIMQMDKGAK
jgi:predicted enzyme related to lactoylglutathione lyase